MDIGTMVIPTYIRPHACIEIDLELVDVVKELSANAEDARKLAEIGRDELQGLAETLSVVYSIIVRQGLTGMAAGSRAEADGMRVSISREMAENGGRYEFVGNRGNVSAVLDLERRKLHFRAKLMHGEASANTIRDTMMFRSSADTMIYALHVPFHSLKYTCTEDYQPKAEKAA
jgi:hypothetical protein